MAKLNLPFRKRGENAAAGLRGTWEALKNFPLGKQLFSQLVGRLAPYTGSIGATVVELGPQGSKVVLEDRPRVRNHLECVHAIALANLAELSGNLALAYGMPADARFIVAGLSIDYAKKARGRITAEGKCPPIPTSARAEYTVNVTMRDEQGEVVATSVLRSLVGPQR
jgi:acyl-coenzyme A thioesterase PaaI-like protein